MGEETIGKNLFKRLFESSVCSEYSEGEGKAEGTCYTAVFPWRDLLMLAFARGFFFFPAVVRGLLAATRTGTDD